jgi:2-polyprenyl-3-methyl-5-hydroxy-6-metoxy-1,4-benzoquinol methylase
VALLRQRNVVPEEMDRPDLPAALHEQALRGLARLNWWSGSDRILWPSIRRVATEIRPRPLRVLDIACGAGDVLVGLARRAGRAGVALELAGIDVSATAIEHARRRTAAAGLSVKLEQRDALDEALPGSFDIVTSSLFLHHLRNDQAIELLRRMAAATTRLVLVNDLRRSPGGWLLASAACRLLSRSPIVHVDGPRSVSAAFSIAEASDLAGKAGLAGAVVARRWPFRYLLTWDRATA